MNRRGPAWVLSLCLPALLAVRAPSAAPTEASAPGDWETLRGTHVLVRHRNRPAFAETVRVRAEALYRTMCGDMGLTRREDFWAWDRRATIVLYPDIETFRRETGSPAWAAGRANPTDRRIELVGESADVVATDLPHELAHLIFRDFLGEAAAVPLWLDEGVAQWLSRPAGGGLVSAGIASRVALADLTRMRTADLTDTSTALAFYIQAASLVEFLVTTRGLAPFVTLCRHLRDGRALAEALRFTYPRDIRTIESLEHAWLQWVETLPDRARRSGGGPENAQKRIHIN